MIEKPSPEQADIVTRLRNLTGLNEGSTIVTALEGADEIERLRAAIDDLVRLVVRQHKRCPHDTERIPL